MKDWPSFQQFPTFDLTDRTQMNTALTMKPTLTLLTALLLLSSMLSAAEQEKTQGGISYAAGDWPASGLGNHRGGGGESR